MENIEYQIEEAYRSWQQAENLFNNAVTKEDVEYAIFNMETKKKNYLRLVRMARDTEKDGRDFL